MFKRFAQRFRRMVWRIFGKPKDDWVDTYNEQPAPVNDDLMDLNNTRR